MLNMKNTLTFLTILLMQFMILSQFIHATPVHAKSVWDGSVADGYAGGTGAEDDPYLIALQALNYHILRI